VPEWPEVYGATAIALGRAGHLYIGGSGRGILFNN
jgi:hypothetical protein